MIQSMTGFATARIRTESSEVAVELRSVNHRHLELHFKLPDEWRQLEPALRERLQAELRRGKVDIAVRLRIEQEEGAARVEINEAALNEVFAQCEHLFPDTEIGTLAQWMCVPGMLKLRVPDQEKVGASVLQCFGEALAELKSARLREGAKTVAVLDERIAQLVTVVEGVQALSPLIREAIATRIRARFAEVNLAVEPARFEQELVLMLQRADVDEEIERLKLHIVELKRLLKSQEPVGRRIDFLLQELNREANTLGAKAQDIRSTTAAVDLKVLLEQIREQIQNLE